MGQTFIVLAGVVLPHYMPKCADAERTEPVCVLKANARDVNSSQGFRSLPVGCRYPNHIVSHPYYVRWDADPRTTSSLILNMAGERPVPDPRRSDANAVSLVDEGH